MDDARFEEIMMAIYSDLPRQGPGSPETTLKALSLCSNLGQNITALDIGCGSGMHTLTLAKAITGTITGIDLFQEFLDTLMENAKQAGLSEKVRTQAADMGQLDFPPQSIDLIWSEAAAYSIGFDNALAHWRQFLKPGGYLGVSELVWLKPNPPEELQAFWADEYPDMRHVDVVASSFSKNGYIILDQFTQPDSDWWAYYDPLEAKLLALREKFQDDADALPFVEGIATEIDIRRRYPDWYGYHFFIAQ